MALRFEKHRPLAVALDGQPVEPHEPEDGRIVLDPAMRADIVLDMTAGRPGDTFRVVDDFYPDLAYRLVDLAYGPEPALRKTALPAPAALPPNTMPEPALSSAERHEIIFNGGMMSGMGMGGTRVVAAPQLHAASPEKRSRRTTNSAAARAGRSRMLGVGRRRGRMPGAFPQRPICNVAR